MRRDANCTLASSLFNALICLTALVCLGGRIAGAQGVIGGGSTTLVLSNPQSPLAGEPPVDPNDPRLFTWKQSIALSGTGWGSSEIVTVYMNGPLNTLGVAPADSVMGTVLTAPDGSIGLNFPQFVTIPYDNGVIGFQGNNLPSIPRPGSYEIHAVGAHANSINPFLDRASAGQINLCPQPLGPLGPYVGPNWQRARGGRDGQVGDLSPERLDPEWLSVWNKQPVALYATVAQTDLQDGNHQSAFISHQEWPGTHYAHDLNLELVPDPQYRWLLSRSNLGNIGEASHGRIEWEWETQNAGNPSTESYGTGNIGIPLWATPTSGDRVYTVGRWPMDNGHPDSGDRTEIHPARLLATMRQRNTVVPFQGAMTRASQVDIFVSGHGGGANQYYDGLEDVLDNKGLGGGRIQDFMPNLPPNNSGVYDTYYHYGPADSVLADLLTNHLGGNDDLIWSVAGPSGIATDTRGLPAIWDTSMPLPSGLNPWTEGPEERPVNDMDYDFDVPLPLPPAGATSVQVLVTTHAEHTTGVNEVITYTTDPDTGLPTGAHIHLPYNGADSGIYARTLNFYWDQFSPPGEHFVVQFNDVNNTNSLDGNVHAWNLWTDVCGQWFFLTGLRPAPFPGPVSHEGFVSKNGDKITGLGAAHFDVYVDAANLLRVFTFGYEVHSYENLFGFEVVTGVNQTRLTTYEVGVNVAEDFAFSDGDNRNIGGALFPRVPQTFDSLVGPHNVDAQPVADSLDSQFNVDFTVTHVNAPTTTALTLTSSKNPSIYGDSVTFTATVARTSKGVTPPTGTLVINIDGSPVTATISSSGNAMTATYSTMALSATSLHTVTATYTNIDGNFGPSGPTSLTQTVTAPCVNNLAGRGTPSGRAPARIDITWTGIPNVTSYNVLRGITSGGPYLLIGNPTVPAYSDTSGLTNGNTYYYVLQPIGGLGSQVCQSNQAAITIPNGR
jgi:hypothetical protein